MESNSQIYNGIEKLKFNDENNEFTIKEIVGIINIKDFDFKNFYNRKLKFDINNYKYFHFNISYTFQNGLKQILTRTQVRKLNRINVEY